MDDLLQLNRSIAEHWLGKLDASHEEYLSFTPVCLGQLPHSANELAKVLATSKEVSSDTLRVLALNRRYLNFARLAGKDVAAGNFGMLVRLGINMEQARLFGSLSNDEVALLALTWQGPIIQFASQSFVQGASMQLGAAKHHATAFIATHA